MSEKLILIDGNSLLTSSFFGALDQRLYKADKQAALAKLMKTSDGRYTNAVFNVTKVLMKLIREYKTSHIAVAFDVNRKTFRKELYTDYKGHRGETADELKSQFPIMFEVLEAMNIKYFRCEGFEADDIIGTLSRKFEDQISTIVMTKDQDALQLVTDKTRVWLNTSTAKDKIAECYGDIPASSYPVPANYFEFTPFTFPTFYGGLEPIQLIDFKALEGDKSDNIPGVRNVGEASIYPLLKEFRTIENIYEYIKNHDESTIKEFFKGLGIKRSPLKHLIEGKNNAFLSKELATIKVDMDHFSTLTLDDLRVSVDEDKRVAKFKELQFNSLL